MKYDYILKQSMIIDNYFDKNGCIPTSCRFKKLGGNLQFIQEHYGTYYDFICSLGYENIGRKKGKKYYLIDCDKNNKVIEYDYFNKIYMKYFSDRKIQNVRHYYTKGVKIKNRYKIFSKEKFEKFKEELKNE